MPTVLITGASGLLGRPLARTLITAGYEVVTHGLSNAAACDFSIDLTQADPSTAMLDDVNPDIVINLVALTNVDACETDPARAYALNVKTVENLAGWVTRSGSAHLVQISTDQVYDGAGPHHETATDIINVYGLSKYTGELVAAAGGGTILRTNFFGWSEVPGRPSFSDWIVDKLITQTGFTAFDDVLFSPLSIPTLGAAILRVCERRATGTYNLGSRGGMSKAQFALELARHFDLDPAPVQAGSVATVQLKARRPQDMRMNCQSFEQAFDFALPELVSEIIALERPDA